MNAWSFYAIGTPASQGSKSFKGLTKGGRAILAESSKKLEPWRNTVTAAAFGAGPKLDSPLIAKVVFTLPKPKSARKSEFAPAHGIDIDKALRSVFDSVTAAGLWADDARVVDMVRLAKVWTGHDDDAMPVPGVLMACATASPSGEDPLYVVDGLFAIARDEVWAKYEGSAA